MTMASDSQYRYVNYDRRDTVKSMEAVREEETPLSIDRVALKVRLYEEFNCCGASCDDAFDLALDLAQDEGEEAVREMFMQLASLILPER